MSQVLDQTPVESQNMMIPNEDADEENEEEFGEQNEAHINHVYSLFRDKNILVTVTLKMVINNPFL